MWIIYNALYKLISIIIGLIFVNAILSWFPGASTSKIGYFINMLTEPVISPIRKLMVKFKFLRSLPVDFSPMVAMLLLILLQQILSVVFSLFF